MPATSLPGIFCLEGEWDPDLRVRDSVQPLLELLERLGIAKAIHRDVATREELRYYLGKWRQKRYSGYPVLYLASHGDSGSLTLGKESVDLAELGAMLQGAARGRVIYFGSCLTLNESDEPLMAFARITGAKAVVGYSKYIDWLESAAFELLLLERLARGNRSDAFFNRLIADHGPFAAHLGLVVATAKLVRDADS